MKILQQKEWENKTFIGLHMEDADLGGTTFNECAFVDCAFINCDFRNVALSNCEFKNSNLSNMPMTHAKMSEVLFIQCKLVGLDFSACKKLLFSIKLDACIVQMCNFSSLKMVGLSFGMTELNECDFYEANLAGTDFRGCNLQGSLFENCDLREADFRNAFNYLIDPNKNQVKKAKFSMPEALSLLAPLELVIE